MTNYHKGDVLTRWNKTTLLVFTANNVIKKNGALVMGRGLAKQMRDAIPDIDLRIGNQITSQDDEDYLLAQAQYAGPMGSQAIAAFQVKRHFKEPASLILIKESTAALFRWILFAQDQNPTGLRVDMNFPGIGNGNLKKAEVKPIIDRLPDCVNVWEYEPSTQMSMMDLYR